MDAERQARETGTVSEPRLARLIDTPIIGIATATVEGIVEANDAFLTMLGRTREELRAGPISWRAMTPVEYVPLDERALEELRERGRCTPFEKEFIREDGTRVPVLICAAALDPAGSSWVAYALDLTGRKQVEAELRESQARFERFMAQLPALVYIKDEAGRHLYVNPRFGTVTGRPVAEVLGRTDHELFSRDVADRLRGNDLAALGLGETLETEETVTLDGGPHTFLSLKFPIEDRRGRRLIGGISIDVTERKRIEAALRESEERYRVLTESIPQLVWVATPEGLASYLNRRWSEYTGLPDAELLGTGWRRVVHPDDVERVESVWQASVDTGGPYVQEYRIRRGDGAFRWHLARGLPLADPGGPIRAWLGTSTEIDDQKRAEETERFMAEASRLLAGSLDAEATVAQVARLALPLFADWTVVDLLRPDGSVSRVTVGHRDPAKVDLSRRLHAYPPRPGSAHEIWEVVRTGEPRLVTEVPESFVAERSQDDDHRAVAHGLGIQSFISVPLLVRGRTIGVLSFVYGDSGRRYGPADLQFAEEIARRAALAIDNARLYREAQEAARARDVFLARASHELRTPLTSVLASIRVLKKALTGRAPHSPAELLEIANRNVAAVLALLNDLLDASKLTAGETPLALEPVVLADVVLAAKGVVEPQADEKGVTLRSMVPDRLVLQSDPLKLLQVLANLLGNAVKFTSNGGTVEVEAGLEEGEEVVIRVRDTGEGIAKADLAHIFEPFAQATRRRRPDARGTGLGLAICRQIVTLHGGHIWAESEGLGRGSTFVVTLPSRRSQREERAA